MFDSLNSFQISQFFTILFHIVYFPILISFFKATLSLHRISFSTSVVLSITLGLSIAFFPQFIFYILPLFTICILWILFNQIPTAFCWGIRQFVSISFVIALSLMLVGCFWLFVAHTGIIPTPFSRTIEGLTAVHFYFTGFCLFSLMGLISLFQKKSLRTQFYLLITLLSGVFLTAVGITLNNAIQILGALVTVLSIWILILLHIRKIQKTSNRLVLLFAFLASLISLSLALLYSLSANGYFTPLSIRFMIVSHGTLNAIGLVGSLIILVVLNKQNLQTNQTDIPFSQIIAPFSAKTDWFEHFIDADSKKQGLTDQFNDFESPHFNPQNLSARIRDFYENTINYKMTVDIKWHGFFKILSPIWSVLSSFFQQVHYPSKVSQANLTNNIVKVNDSLDGRPNVRAWIRKYKETGKTLYLALYSQTKIDQTVYMNIAFPFPFCQLTSLLKPQIANNHLQLTTKHNSFPDRQGIYLVSKYFTVCLPMDETIDVWEEDSTLKALHEVKLFNLSLLTLEYKIES